MKQAAQEITGKLLKLQTTLDRFTAPNMRALEKSVYTVLCFLYIEYGINEPLFWTLVYL